MNNTIYSLRTDLYVEVLKPQVEIIDDFDLVLIDNKKIYLNKNQCDNKIYKIENINKSNCKLILTSMFDDIVIDLDTVKDDTLSVDLNEYIKICDKNNSSFIEKLSDKDTINIYYSNFGCFGGNSEQIKIYKNNKNLVAKKDTQTKLLTRQQIENYKNFEKQIINIDEKGGCTSTSIVIIRKGKEIKYFRENTCVWKDYYIFTSDLFSDN